MSCVYKRGNTLWVAYNDATGKRVCRTSGFRVGQEAEANAFLAELERELAESAKVRPTPVVADVVKPAPGPIVRAYGDAWIKGRAKRVESVDDEEGHLRNHVYPRIGDVAMRDIKPRHIRDFVVDLSQAKVNRRAKGGGGQSTIAPRTVRHVFATLHRMFKSAVIDEVIETNPVVVEKGILPKNIDKDPEWRATAVFDRGELISLISDVRIPQVRRMVNALKGLAALRHGEAAGLRWSDYHPAIEPLGKLVIARSYDKERTKTKITREVPVHPVLARLLAEWKLSGWSTTFGRMPKANDLIVPSHDLDVWPAHEADDMFKQDLGTIGLRNRRGHDLRRTFITLAQVDGARRDILKVMTHGPAADDIINLYTSFPWPTLCAEVAKLSIVLPATDAAPTVQRETLIPKPETREPLLTLEVAKKSSSEIVPHAANDCSATCSATCSADFVSNFEPLAGYDPATYGLRNRCSTTELQRRGEG